MLAPGLILVVIGWLAAWSNHFDSGFHFNDVPTIVANEPVHHLSSIPRFFEIPRISSAEKDSATYQPLLSSWFAFDWWLSGGRPFTFQLANWLWFFAELVAMFLLFRTIPGVHYFAAGFATLLFGLHPVMADTVNYVLQRGVIMSAFGVTTGLLLFICWPWRVPQTLPLRLKRVPENDWDEFLRKNFDRLEKIYLRIIHFPSGLYLWPVIPALLSQPATAVFAPILLVYILLFETKRSAWHALPAAIVCIGYWIFQLAFTWRLGEVHRTPAANYWFTQPWVALRCFGRFFAPVHLSVDTGLNAFAHLWDPLAIAGYAGVAALIVLAVVTGRKSKWRAVSFGLWWFLLALLPDALVPHRMVEADWRMFLPFAGLALAVAGLASMGLEAVPQGSTEDRRRLIPLSIAGVLALALLAVSGWATWQRSSVWQSEATLWRNAVDVNPRNGRALMHYGLALLAGMDPGQSFDYFQRADAVSPNDPLIEITLADALARRGQTTEAEREFRRAIENGPAWSPGYSAYAQWLLDETRLPEALTMSNKALALDPYDLVARRNFMDLMARTHEWDKLKRFALDTLRLLPGNPDGERSLEVAQTGLDQIARSETVAKTEPTVNNYLDLSVQYFNTERYEDCIRAAQEALKINPNTAEAYANMASAYHSLGKLDETIAALEAEVRLNPDLPRAKSNLAVELAEKAKQQQGH